MSDNNLPKQGFTAFFERIFIFRDILDSLPRKYIAKSSFLLSLGLLYIWNNHSFAKLARELVVKKSESESLRSKYTMIKAEYMYKIKRSQIEDIVKAINLEVPNYPPYRVKLKNR